MTTYNTRVAKVADGSTTRWTFSFAGGYILPEHVKVSIEGGEATTAVLETEGTVVIDPPLADGTAFEIFRQTPTDEPLVDWTNGADISETTLDASTRQAIFVAAEAEDAIAVGLSNAVTSNIPRSVVDVAPGDVVVVDESGNLSGEAMDDLNKIYEDTEAAKNETELLLSQVVALSNAVEVETFAEGLSITAPGESFVIFFDTQVRRYKNGTSVDVNDPVFVFPDGEPVPIGPEVTPSASWTGVAGSGFTSIPTDPARSTAKPIAAPLFVPRQTITDELVIGVAGGANNNGSLRDNLGIDYIDFMFEGTVTRVSSPDLRTFTRPDGSSYVLFGWWITLKKPTGTEGTAQLYYEAVAKDTSMQHRVEGPFDFGLFDAEHDLEVTVAAGGGADYTNMGDAFDAVAAAAADRPKITVTEAGDYSLAGGSSLHKCEFWCTITATAAVTFVEDPPTLAFDFTRIRPRISNLRFKGPNVTHDFVQTLQFDPLFIGAAPWYSDGAKIRQSDGRNALWRLRPRNINPALFAGGSGSTVYLTEADIKDVNDVGDKSALVRGCVIDETWSDLFQGSLVVVGNKTTNHSSAFYYTNVDALTVEYTGVAATATISRTGGEIICRENGAAVLTFPVSNTEAAYRDDTNYRVASVANAINALTDWTATLLDDTRVATSLSAPGTTNGGNFVDLDVKTAAQTLPTHFDIHSDYWQAPNSSFLTNVYVGQNLSYDCDMQNTLIAENVPGNTTDILVIANVFHNRTGVPDEDLQASAGNGSHILIVGNTFASQRLAAPNSSAGGGDAYSLVSNNVSVRLAASPAGDPDVAVTNNHVHNDVGLSSEAVGTSIGGDSFTLFVDAANGDFTPAGDLLTNATTSVIPFDVYGRAFAATDAKGGVAF